MAYQLLLENTGWNCSEGKNSLKAHKGKFYMSTALIQEEFQTVIEQKSRKEVDRRVFGNKVGLIAKLFGCWHEDIGRPFVEGKTAYRACLGCGARKQFDPNTLKTFGNFYYPPLVKRIENL